MPSYSSYKISLSTLSALLGVSVSTIESRLAKGDLKVETFFSPNGEKLFSLSDLRQLPPVASMLESRWEEEELAVQGVGRRFSSVELFAGAGGLALGLERMGFEPRFLCELDADACSTLRANRAEWPVFQGDVRDVDFEPYRGGLDLLSGGFPCQAFSYAGQRGGFADTRGTLFFELARAAQVLQPKVVLGENVKGLVSHDGGRTLGTIRATFEELGYFLIEPKVLRAVMYKVPQKRERLFLVAIRNDLVSSLLPYFQWPSPYKRPMVLQDALFAGDLYNTDVPPSEGATYPARKARVLAMVPQGGNWRDLPAEEQRDFLGGSYHLGGGKTGIARRLSLLEPSLTLVCSPAQKQTERCHPLHTRPLTIREYARVQTFPDSWQFTGGLSSVYRQIGNAVPVNLAAAVGRSVALMLIRALSGGIS